MAVKARLLSLHRSCSLAFPPAFAYTPGHGAGGGSEGRPFLACSPRGSWVILSTHAHRPQESRVSHMTPLLDSMVVWTCNLVLVIAFLLLALPVSSEPRPFKCSKEPLPEFSLGEHSNPSDAEVAKLCACIWSKLPEGGWERDVAIKWSKGQDPGWRARGFAPRFGAAMRACGGDKL